MMGRRDSKYWNGETERERVIREMLTSKRHMIMTFVIAVLQAVALVFLGIAFGWLCLAFG